MNVRTYLDRYLALLETELKETLASPHSILSPYYGMMQYHMGWLDEQFRPVQASQGKRLRPVLCLLACEAVGGQIEHALPAATAIELHPMCWAISATVQPCQFFKINASR